ncbi:hypothetical protein sos41_12590 [Alphaproteobacteria bacterium SO-S41]|nr:hypothetical protein sos41_12590 [Alphaproteobacteria bacterium SO-S41]
MIVLGLLSALVAAAAPALTLEAFDAPPPLCWIDPHEYATMAAAANEPNAFMTAGGLYLVVEPPAVPPGPSLYDDALVHEATLRAAAKAANIELGVGIAIVLPPDGGGETALTYGVAIPVLDARSAPEATATNGVTPVLLRLPPAKVAHVRWEGPPADAVTYGTNFITQFLAQSGTKPPGALILEFYNLADAKAPGPQTIEVCMPFD